MKRSVRLCSVVAFRFAMQRRSASLPVINPSQDLSAPLPYYLRGPGMRSAHHLPPDARLLPGGGARPRGLPSQHVYGARTCTRVSRSQLSQSQHSGLSPLTRRVSALTTHASRGRGVPRRADRPCDAHMQVRTLSSPAGVGRTQLLTYTAFSFGALLYASSKASATAVAAVSHARLNPIQDSQHPRPSMSTRVATIATAFNRQLSVAVGNRIPAATCRTCSHGQASYPHSLQCGERVPRPRSDGVGIRGHRTLAHRTARHTAQA